MCAFTAVLSVSLFNVHIAQYVQAWNECTVFCMCLCVCLCLCLSHGR